MSLGQQTYLKAKAVGESSMSAKPGCHEAAKRQARRGPDGMVKAKLPEPQCPNSNGFWPATADESRLLPLTA
jgi:hypothetical protein